MPPSHLGGSHAHHGAHGHLAATVYPFPQPSTGPHRGPDAGDRGRAVKRQLGRSARFPGDAGCRGGCETGPTAAAVRLGGEFLPEDQGDLPAAEFTAPECALRYHTTSVPVVRIGGVAAKVVYSGLAPGRKGVWQIDVLAPEDAPAGSAVPVEISYEGAAEARGGPGSRIGG